MFQDLWNHTLSQSLHLNASLSFVSQSRSRPTLLPTSCLISFTTSTFSSIPFQEHTPRATWWTSSPIRTAPLQKSSLPIALSLSITLLVKPTPLLAPPPFFISINFPVLGAFHFHHLIGTFLSLLSSLPSLKFVIQYFNTFANTFKSTSSLGNSIRIVFKIFSL